MIKSVIEHIKQRSPELQCISINNTEQFISIRGKSGALPVLFLHGGPGGSEIALQIANYKNNILENYFQWINWDQPGTGKSLHAGHIKPLSISRITEDALTLCKYIRELTGKSKIALVAHSWGSIPAMRMIKKEPLLFSHLISISPLFRLTESESLSLEWLKRLAKEQMNNRALKKLNRLSIPFPQQNNIYSEYVRPQRKLMSDLGALYYDHHRRHLGKTFMNLLFYSGYTFLDIIKLAKGLKYSINSLWGEMMSINYFSEITSVDVPVTFMMGRYDAIAIPEVVNRYFHHIDAPRKEILWFEHSSHMPMVDEKELYQQQIIRILSNAEY